MHTVPLCTRGCQPCQRPLLKPRGTNLLPRLRCGGSSSWAAGSMPTTAAATGSHPDALRRRQEAEEWAAQRLLEKERSRSMEASGQKWWQLSTQHITLMASVQQFREQLELNKDKLVVAACFTEDCFICKSLHPKLHKIAEKSPDDVVFLKMNGTCPTFRPLFEDLGITAVPWFLFFRGGKCVHSMSASLNPERLQAFRASLEQLRFPPVMAGP